MKCNYCGGQMRLFHSDKHSCIICGRENRMKPCPFCGSDCFIHLRSIKVDRGNKVGDRYNIKCPLPSCFLHKDSNNRYLTPEDAIKAWEIRYDPDKDYEDSKEEAFDENYEFDENYGLGKE